MARMEVVGADTLLAGLDGMARDLPQLRDDILKAEADIIETAIKGSIAEAGAVRSGRLLRSTSRRKTKSAIRIGPNGEHHRYLPSKGKSGIVTAGYVGYINEYGLPSRGIKARKYMQIALKRNEGKAFAAAEAVYTKYTQKHNL